MLGADRPLAETTPRYDDRRGPTYRSPALPADCRGKRDGCSRPHHRRLCRQQPDWSAGGEKAVAGAPQAIGITRPQSDRNGDGAGEWRRRAHRIVAHCGEPTAGDPGLDRQLRPARPRTGRIRQSGQRGNGGRHLPLRQHHGQGRARRGVPHGVLPGARRTTRLPERHGGGRSATAPNREPRHRDRELPLVAHAQLHRQRLPGRPAVTC